MISASRRVPGGRYLMIAVTALIFSAQGSKAQQIPGPYGPAITLEQARIIVDAAHREAEKRRFTMAFAVATPSGEPILLEVMDGTQTGSIPLASAKAKTAARYRRPTKAFSEDIAGKAALTYSSVNDIVTLEGGLPILSNGRVIGALGVSGGTSAQDGEIATIALAQD